MPDLSWFIKSLDLGLRIWLGLALASAILVFGPDFGLTFLSGIPPAVSAFAKVGLVVFGCLSGVGMLATAWNGVEWGWALVMKRRAKSARARWAEKSLDDLTARERNILSFLVTRGERHFTADMNGGYAASLIGRGLIHRTVRRGHTFHALSAPYSVDEDVWKALQKRKNDFKHHNPDGRPPHIDSPW